MAGNSLALPPGITCCAWEARLAAASDGGVPSISHASATRTAAEPVVRLPMAALGHYSLVGSLSLQQLGELASLEGRSCLPFSGLLLGVVPAGHVELVKLAGVWDPSLCPISCQTR